MDTFTVRDLRERTSELVRDAEQGKLSVVTKHGVPVFVAVPFDERLVQYGLLVALAMRLFDEEVVSLGQAAKLAGLSPEDFVERLAAAGISVARYSAADLEEEVQALGVERKPQRYRGRKTGR
jgi:prevent-host-death family protein